VVSQFDRLARMYEDMFALPWRRDLECFSVLRLLGELSGASVLDIGCGTGLYSRLLRRQGAARVVGFDVSEGMLEHARRLEAAEPLGITYTATPPPPEPVFDLVLGVYVLPYATEFAELVALCSLACGALCPGGRFVTLPIHPRYDGRREYYGQYGFRMFDAEPRADSSRVTLNLRFGPYDETVTARYWSATALEAALSEAGFAEVAWPPFAVSPAGLAERGEAFWRQYLDCPHAALIEARKA
jgi:toxoflavin synthase